MTSPSVRRAGALVLVLEVGYLLLLQLAFAVFTVGTREIDHPEAEPAGGLGTLLFLAGEGAVVLLLLWGAASLGLAAFADRGPAWARAVGFVLVAATQVYVVWEAASNALAQDAGPDVLVNAVMVLGALVATAACLLGLRGGPRRAPLQA